MGERPRELRWYHAAGMLFGDWGTSRLYVLGLAFVMSGHASFWYVTAMCALVAIVGFAYTIVCSHFPDGGGVYSSAKQRSKPLAVVGALLLVADYIITASLSAYEGFRYILPHHVDSKVAMYAAGAAILAIGTLNVYGPRRVGVMATIVAVLTACFYLILAIFCIKGTGTAVFERPNEPFTQQWGHFVNVILALSGVEAIANMTGVIAEPVAKNTRKAILVVLVEVVVLNLVMAYAMNGLPASVMAHYPREDQQDHMLKILAIEYVGPTFAWVASITFGLLLLAAANTAIGGMVSIQYLMSRDKELPQAFTALNRFGMPWVGLITATVVPVIVLLLVGANTKALGDLYAIGVVGAIAINLLACASNKELKVKKWERGTLWSVGILITIIEVTIAFQKPMALLFAVLVLLAGLGARFVAQRKPVVIPAAVVPKPAAALTESAIRIPVPAGAARLLVPTRGGPKLLKFAAGYAKDKKAALYVLFVREVALAFRERGAKVGAETMTLANDQEAQRIFVEARKICEDAGVPLVPIYMVHDSAAEMILDEAATLGVDAVIMGVSKRGALWKTLKGDVLQEVIQYLPESIPLLIHA